MPIHVQNDPVTAGVYEYWNTFVTDATIGPGQVYVVCVTSVQMSLLRHKQMRHRCLALLTVMMELN